MQVWNLLHAARCKYRTQKSRQKSPSGHHRTTSSGYIFAAKARIDNRKKSLLSSNTSSTCPHNVVNFGPVTAEIGWPFGAPLRISTGFASWQRYCTASTSGRQPNFAALNRGRHLYLAGRPSGWALTHISSSSFFIRILILKAISTVFSLVVADVCSIDATSHTAVINLLLFWSNLLFYHATSCE